MKRSKRMQIVVELAERKERDAATACEKIRKLIDDETKKLGELQNYYLEYENSFSAATQNVRGADILRNRLFLQRLKQAVEGQQGVIAQFEQEYQTAKQAWLESRRKLQSFIDLVKSIKQQEAKLDEKMEQKLIDEWVNRINSNGI